MKDYRDRTEMVHVEIEAPHSYQIKRVMKALEKVKGLRMMSTSGVKRKRGPKFICCQICSFEDTKNADNGKNRYNRKSEDKPCVK